MWMSGTRSWKQVVFSQVDQQLWPCNAPAVVAAASTAAGKLSVLMRVCDVWSGSLVAWLCGCVRVCVCVLIESQVSEIAGVKLDRQVNVVAMMDGTALPLPPTSGMVDANGKVGRLVLREGLAIMWGVSSAAGTFM